MAGETSKFLRRTEVAYYLDDGFDRTQVRHPPCFVYRHRRLFKAADCRKCFRHRMKARWVSGRHSLPRYSASIQCLIRCGMIRVSKSWPPRKRRNSVSLSFIIGEEIRNRCEFRDRSLAY